MGLGRTRGMRGLRGVVVDGGAEGRGSISVVGIGIYDGGVRDCFTGSSGCMGSNLLRGSFPARARACATGSKDCVPSCDVEVNDDDGSSSAISLAAIAVDA